MHVARPTKITKNATRYTTTTSMVTPQQQNPSFQEGRLLLSINTYKESQFTSFQNRWFGGVGHMHIHACWLRYSRIRQFIRNLDDLIPF